MLTKLTLAAAVVLAVTPAAVTVLVPSPKDESIRAVSIRSPIIGFTQSRDRIQVRIRPAVTSAERDTRARVLITDSDGDQLAIPLKRGQTWASTELPPTIASADSIQISVE
jgi:hypothetical protein